MTGGPDGAMRFVRPAVLVALAHHPLCSDFRDDVYRLGPLRMCRGCVLTIPTFLAGAALAPAAARFVSPSWLILVALALGVPQLVTYRVRLTPRVRVLVKLSGGTGLGLLLVTLFLAGLPHWAVVAALASLATAFVALQSLRAVRMLRTCRRCPWKMDWDHCPGFGGI